MKFNRYSLLVFILCFCLFACSDKSDFIDEFNNYPNPFDASSEYTTFYVKTTDATITIKKANVIIYSPTGDELANLDMDDTTTDETVVKWHGVDKNGGILPSTLYYAEVSVENDDGNISRASTKVLIK